MELTSGAFINTWLPFIVAGIIQASFGLGVSMLTLISGHSLYKKRSRSKLLRLSSAYIWGTILLTFLLLVAVTYVFSIERSVDNTTIWTVVCGIAAGIGVAVMLFYYRRGRGTMLWLPRSAAEYLYDRTKKTDNGFEAFLLGVGAIFAELIFVVAPLLIAAILLAGQPSWAQLGGICLYVLIASLPMIGFQIAVSGGKKVSDLQNWREKNKTFLQVTSGIGLIVLALYIFVFNVIGVSV